MKKLFFSVIYFTCFQVLLGQRNVIVIIADDLGSDYCGFSPDHLDTARMPNVRRLLNRGVYFNNAWSNPLCSPTRSSILTGRYAFRTGMGDVVQGATSTQLDTAEITIPEMIKSFKGKTFPTANVGKWHLHSPLPVSHYKYPNIMGYDYYSGNFSGQLSDYYSWQKITQGIVSTCNEYATTKQANEAISWIKSQGNKNFFLCLAFNAPHNPYHLPPKNLLKDTSLSGSASDISANPIKYFKAMIDAMDHEIGRLFDTLQAKNLWNTTDIIFIGDNGDDPFVEQKPIVGTGGGAKGSIYQRGICVPFIASGPDIVNPNRSSDALINVSDIYATVLDIMGDVNWNSRIPSNKPVDSKSLWPILKNSATTVREWTFAEVFKNPTISGDGKTMRNEKYKLLDFDNGTQKFYNISTDPYENKNLLLGTLSGTELSNYNYLCDQMTQLVGAARFCSLTNASVELSVTETVNSYPNPFYDHVILAPRLKNEPMLFTDMNGKILFKGIGIENQIWENLPNGLYLLKPMNFGKTVKLEKIER